MKVLTTKKEIIAEIKKKGHIKVTMQGVALFFPIEKKSALAKIEKLDEGTFTLAFLNNKEGDRLLEITDRDRIK
jgi:hypothetical protein